jgi:prepilin-type processing-associated H-X9-DG protein
MRKQGEPFVSGVVKIEQKTRKCRLAAFTRVELATVAGVLIAIVSLGAVWIVKPRHISREAQCAINLKALGAAMAMYEQANNDRLPYAMIRYPAAEAKNDKTWDTLIYPFVPPNDRGLAQKHFLQCPADTLPAKGDQRRRTYSMPAHNMIKQDWPPGTNNGTGVGLWWTYYGKNMAALKTILPKTSAPSTNSNAEVSIVQPKLPAISLSMIQAPAATLLLTEHAAAGNLAFNFSGSTIGGPSEHLDKKVLKAEEYHDGKINYLMVDGHAEMLFPLQSIGQHDPRDTNPEIERPNIWTIRAND